MAKPGYDFHTLTVAQKNAPMFAHLSMIALVYDADIIQGSEILSNILHNLGCLEHFRSCDLDESL